MTRNEFQTLEQEYNSLLARKSEIENQIQCLREKCIHMRKERLKGNRIAQSDIDATDEKLAGLQLDLLALDELLIEALAKFKPDEAVALEIENATKEMASIPHYSKEYQAMRARIGQMTGKYEKALVQRDTLQLALCQDQLEELEAATNPLQDEILSLEQRLTQLRSDSRLSDREVLASKVAQLRNKVDSKGEKYNAYYGDPASRYINFALQKNKNSVGSA